jgi:hypothetical protein
MSNGQQTVAPRRTKIRTVWRQGRNPIVILPSLDSRNICCTECNFAYVLTGARRTFSRQIDLAIYCENTDGPLANN